jgi:hypothetical protein
MSKPGTTPENISTSVVVLEAVNQPGTRPAVITVGIDLTRPRDLARDFGRELRNCNDVALPAALNVPRFADQAGQPNALPGQRLRPPRLQSRSLILPKYLHVRAQTLFGKKVLAVRETEKARDSGQSENLPCPYSCLIPFAKDPIWKLQQTNLTASSA